MARYPDPQERSADELCDQIIQHVAFIDEHRPPTLWLWIFANLVEDFADFVAWRENLKIQEHGDPPPD